MTNHAIPLLNPAQAQKHVTVNEALLRLDAAANLVLQSRSVSAPPPAPNDGQAWAVPTGATGDWSGRDGQIAASFENGWHYLSAQTGWRAWIADEASAGIWDGTDWRADLLALSASGAATLHSVVEITHSVTAGGDNTTALMIPERACLLAVTGRVTTAITGTLATFSIGISGTPNKFSSGLALAAGSNFVGPSPAEVYWTATPVMIFGEGGDLATGEVRLTAHFYHFNGPE